MTNYPTLDDKLSTLRHAIEGGVKADTMQAMKLCELVDAIGEQFKREVADASAPSVDGARDEREAFEAWWKTQGYGDEIMRQINWQAWQARAALSASTEAALKENQIQVTHTIATEQNAATILHGLLDSFVEVAAGFPQAKIDEALKRQAAIYLRAKAAAGEPDKTFAALLMDAAAKSGDPGAISLAAQLAGAAPCDACGFVNYRCRCVTAHPAASPIRTYTTQPGESVAGIAFRECGNEAEWRHILACNPQFADLLPHDYFPVGTVLTLPPRPSSATASDKEGQS